MDAKDDTATFLDQVLPWPNGDLTGWVNIHSPWLRPGAKKPVFPGYAFTNVAGAAREVAWKVSKNNNVYVCMSLQKDARELQSGKPKRRAMRHATTAVAFKGFWIDIDLKPSFVNLEELLTKFGTWQRTVGLPFPSLIIFTGGGCHFHWVLPSLITPEVWQPLAEALKEACIRHDLKADDKCTADGARLMRVPGTFNHKFNPPKPVTIIHLGGLVRLEELAKALAPYNSVTRSPRAGTYAPRVTLSLPPGGKPSKVFDGVELGPALDDGLDPIWKPARGEVAAVCPWFQDTLIAGGLGAREPEWFEALKVAYHCDDPLTTAHEVSKGHADYNKGETDEKFESASKSAETYGWPQCRTIKEAGATQCGTICPKLSQGKSPLNFVAPPAHSPASGSAGQGTGTPPPPPPPGSNGAAPPPPGKSFMPDDYRFDAKGRLEQYLPTEDKKGHVWKLIYPVPVSDFKHQEINDEIKYGREMMYFQFEGAKRTRPAQIPMDSVHDPRTFKSVLSKQGMTFKDQEAHLLGRFMVSFVQQLRAAQHLSIQCEPYGWAMKDGVEDAFTFDGVRFNCNGNRQIAPPDATVGEKFRSHRRASISGRQACRLITDQHRPDLNAIIACALAAPLVQMTGHNGFVVSAYSTATGVQKSAAMRVVAGHVGSTRWAAWPGSTTPITSSTPGWQRCVTCPCS